MSDQGQFSSVQVRSKSDQIKIRSCRVSLDQDRTSQVRSVQVRAGQVISGLGRIRSGQFKSCQVR